MKLETYVPTKEYDLDVNVLGLRQLESFGLMPIKKPFVKFRVKSMLPPEKAQAVTNVSTDPNACGPNPNINTMLTFNVQLPVEELYCPSLSCDCFDYVFMGFSQPLIGTFNIPVGLLKTKAENKREKDIEICDEILAFLRMQLQKSGDQMNEESKSRSASRSGLSVDAQKLMQKKLLANQNKLRGAVKGVKAAGIFARAAEIEPEKKSPKSGGRGYNELLDEGSGERMVTVGDEENQLLKDEIIDDTLFQDLAEDDPLLIERRALLKAKQDMDNYVARRTASKVKPNSQDANMKASLQKALLNQKIKFKEEQKKAQALKREIERQEMKESGQEASANVILPKYVMNDALKVYEEVEMPPKSIYKAVGYNDMQRVKIFIEGDEAEKRLEAGSNIASASIIKRQKSTSARNRGALDADILQMEEANRK